MNNLDQKQKNVAAAIRRFVNSMHSTCHTTAHRHGRELDDLLIELLADTPKSDYGHAGILFAAFRDAILDL